MLKVEGLTVAYGGVKALEGVSLSIPDGAIVSIVGANGAGKTTTINAISGMVPIRSGRITLDGEELCCKPRDIVRRGIVQVPEGRKVFASITVKENLILGAYIVNDRGRVAKKMDEVLDMFPALRNRLKQHAGTLSGGEQQMLAIGRALMSEPRILLMDEPSLGLAPIIVLEIFKMIQAFNAKGLTILLVEQNAQKALSIAHHAYVLETGRLVTEGEGKQIASDPVVRKAYLNID